MIAATCTRRIRPLAITVSALFLGALLANRDARAEPDPEADSALKTALVEARDRGREFHLRVRCASDKGARRLQLFPDGIAIWENRAELFVEAEERRELAGILLDKGFTDLEAEYGGKIKATRQQAPLRVSCLVEFDVNGVRKRSQQYVDGFQSQALRELANALLDRVAPLVDARGTEASSLTDGLEKLATEQLSSHAFYLRLLELPADRRDGSVMEIQGDSVSIRTYSQGSDVGDRETFDIQRSGTERIAKVLHRSGIESMPVNLWAQGLVELEVRILGHRKTTIARDFMRMTPDGPGEAQKRFNRLISELQQIRSELLDPL